MMALFAAASQDTSAANLVRAARGSSMSKLKVTQRRSVIDRPKDQKVTVRRLGLHRINDSVIKEDTPSVRGMVAKVHHLVEVEEVDG
jgi:large subunit ribosomal protein L30